MLYHETPLCSLFLTVYCDTCNTVHLDESIVNCDRPRWSLYVRTSAAFSLGMYTHNCTYYSLAGICLNNNSNKTQQILC